MIKIATPLAFDRDGKALHKGDLCDMPDGQSEAGKTTVEILDIVPQNKVVVIMPDGDTKVTDSTGLISVERAKEGESFETPSVTTKQPGIGQQRVILLTPNDLIIDGAADALLAVMRKVSKAVRVLQYKVNKVERQKLAEDGTVTKGIVECQAQVQDNMSARKGTATLRLAIEDGNVKEPTEFEGGEQKYPFTEAGFKKWLDISSTPYYSKKPSPVVKSNRDSY